MCLCLLTGFLFLRLICPHMLNAPELTVKTGGLRSLSSAWFVTLSRSNRCDVVAAAADNRRIRRNLLLVTKVLQNVANGVKFGAKENVRLAFTFPALPGLLLLTLGLPLSVHDSTQRLH